MTDTPGRAAGLSDAERRTLWLVAMASFTSMASMRACDSMLPALSRHFGVSAGTAAQAISVFAIAYGTLQFFFGPLGDRLGKVRVIGVAAALCSAFNLAIALSDSLGALLLARTLAGAAGGGIVPLGIALIGDSVSYDRRQEVLSRLLLATISGMVAGQWLGGVIADTLGWRAMFWALALGFASAYALMLRDGLARRQAAAAGAEHAMQDAAQTARVTSAAAGDATVTAPGDPPGGAGERRASMPRQVLQLLHLRWARHVLVVAWLEGVLAFAGFTFIPVYLQQRFGLTAGWAGAVMALYGAGGLIYAAAAPRIIRGLGEQRMAVVGGLGMGAAMAVMALGPHWAWAVLACPVGGLCMYMMHNTLQANASQMVPQIRGTAVSMFASCLFFGQSLGVAAGAVVLDHASPPWIFGACALGLPALGWWFGRGLSQRDRWQSRDQGAFK